MHHKDELTWKLGRVTPCLEWGVYQHVSKYILIFIFEAVCTASIMLMLQQGFMQPEAFYLCFIFENTCLKCNVDAQYKHRLFLCLQRIKLCCQSSFHFSHLFSLIITEWVGQCGDVCYRLLGKKIINDILHQCFNEREKNAGQEGGGGL